MAVQVTITTDNRGFTRFNEYGSNTTNNTGGK